MLIDEARDRYRYVSEGGYNPVIIQDDLSKELIVDPNINTKEKLLKFLQKTYTDNAAQKICDELGYEEIDGKLYRALCDCIFIHDWDKASIKDIKVNPLTKSATVIFALPGPFAESNSNDSVKDIVKFKLIKSKDNTYKIDNMIGGW
ncbi:DL-endopeptidase inhibitor IseA family protein [Caloranaerobacter azorensis]|uniref:DUF3828 domain-containing protein n=1 Tax=Caloranaerobacter azorensis TaxID=116090 RepID=A0A6P1YAM5_9FIRM|nr:DL-endopeptidase inhibitor IseA family protein [Caloranaerobacter azorensis]QIB25922.1 hypothetical protein G3A45_00465 [Caloranaerobacter azorensis]